TTSAPATKPARTAVGGFRNADAALLATRPAIHPLATKDASGRPNRNRVTIAAAKPEAAAESVVFTAISTTANGSLRLNKIALAEFRASHPTQASKHPVRTSTMLWAGIAAGSRLEEYFPRRGPRIQAIDNALSPPIT